MWSVLLFLQAVGVKAADGRNIKFSQETVLYPERYEIVWDNGGVYD